MDYEYDSKAKAAYIRYNQGTVAASAEVEANVIADYDANGRVLGIEVLNIADGTPIDRGKLLEKAMRGRPTKKGSPPQGPPPHK